MEALRLFPSLNVIFCLQILNLKKNNNTFFLHENRNLMLVSGYLEKINIIGYRLQNLVLPLHPTTTTVHFYHIINLIQESQRACKL